METLSERHFWLALGNHVLGTWHQTKLPPIFSSGKKVAKHYSGKIKEHLLELPKLKMIVRHL